MARRARRLATGFTFALLLAGLGFGVRCTMMRWNVDELGAASTAPAAALEPDQLRVITLNGWHLRQVHRVRPFLEAAAGAARLLSAQEPGAPELLAMQELESQAVLDALRDGLAPSHGFFSCVCTSEPAADFNAVAVAYRLDRFEAATQECIELGRLAPDKPRCAALVKLLPKGGAPPVYFATAQLAWRLASAPQADRLREQLRRAGALDSGRLVLAGDSNTWPGTEAYAHLTAPPLRDLLPGARPTHFIGKRVDLIVAGAQVEVMRGLDRRSSFELMPPTSDLSVPAACEHTGPPECPVSDHLPEGAVIRFRAGP